MNDMIDDLNLGTVAAATKRFQGPYELDCPFCPDENRMDCVSLDRHVSLEHYGAVGFHSSHIAASQERCVSNLIASIEKEPGIPHVVIVVDLANTAFKNSKTAFFTGDKLSQNYILRDSAWAALAQSRPIHVVMMWELFLPFYNGLTGTFSQVVQRHPSSSLNAMYAMHHPESGDFALARFLASAQMRTNGAHDVRFLVVTNDHQQSMSINMMYSRSIVRMIRGSQFPDFVSRLRQDVISLLE